MCAQLPQVAMLRTCPDMTLAVEIDVSNLDFDSKTLERPLKVLNNLLSKRQFSLG